MLQKHKKIEHEISEINTEQFLNEKCIITRNSRNYILIVSIIGLLICSPIIGYILGKMYPIHQNNNPTFNQYEFAFQVDYQNFQMMSITVTNESYTEYRNSIHQTYCLNQPEQAMIILSLYIEPNSTLYISEFIRDTIIENYPTNYTDEMIINGLYTFSQAKDNYERFYPNYIDDTIDYAKYPIETLYEGGGDCEDLTILCVSLLKSLGYNSRFYLTWNETTAHVLPIIELDTPPTWNVEEVYSYVEIDDKKYYFAETTSFGFHLGEFPTELLGWNYTISEIL